MRTWKSVLKREFSRLVAWGFLALALLVYPLLLILFSTIALFYHRRVSRRRATSVIPKGESGT